MHCLLLQERKKAAERSSEITDISARLHSVTSRRSTASAKLNVTQEKHDLEARSFQLTISTPKAQRNKRKTNPLKVVVILLTIWI
jgi:ATP phosphoribosyltransferase